MAVDWIDADKIRSSLSSFFSQNQPELQRFGSSVNQVFEAFVFASTIAWYVEKKWEVEFVHPAKKTDGTSELMLKFSPTGKPSGYSFARCKRKKQVIEIRHQLRVATKHHRKGHSPAANLCLDVAVIRPTNLSSYTTKDALPNSRLLTFGEAKHSSAFAELVASFVGLVHEMQPRRLRSIRSKKRRPRHVPPFLYVSGFINPSAQGLKATIEHRGFDIDIWSRADAPPGGWAIPTKPAPPKPKRKRKVA